MKTPLQSIRSFALLLAVSFVIAVPAASAGTPKRVTFARGRTSATLKGSLAGNAGRTYVLGARAGQTMTLHVSVPGSKPNQHVVFSIVDPNGVDLLESYDTDWSGELTATGDYQIAVSAFESAAAKYVLEVTIR